MEHIILDIQAKSRFQAVLPQSNVALFKPLFTKSVELALESLESRLSGYLNILSHTGLETFVYYKGSTAVNVSFLMIPYT